MADVYEREEATLDDQLTAWYLNQIKLMKPNLKLDMKWHCATS